MRRLLQTLFIVLAFSGAGLAQDWAWNDFSPSGGEWTIFAPGKMNPDAEAQEPNSKMGSYSYTDFYGFFAVVYRDSPKRWVPWKPNYNAHYKRVRKDFAKAGKGQVLKEADFTNGDIKGREVYIKIPSGTMTGTEGQVITKYRTERIRMFFVGKRFYLLLVVLPQDLIETPAVDKFFNSFAAKSL